MKTLKDILPIAVFAGTKLLVSFKGLDTTKEDSECLYIDLVERTVSKQPLQRMLKFTPYEGIDESQISFYQDEIYKKISNQKLVNSILEVELN